jgi:hypothetical protein
LSCLTSTQIWLIPVWDNSQSTYLTKLKKEKEEKSLGKVLQIYRHLLNLSWDAHT